MSLNNSQFDKIKNIFLRRRSDASAALLDRVKEIEAKSPEYKKLCDYLSQLRFDKASAILSGEKDKAESLTKEIEDLVEQRKVLLLSLGFSSDYDQIKYVCDKCNDTGFANGEKCGCFKKLQSELLFDASNIKEMLERENFDTFDIEYFDKIQIDPSTKRTCRELMEANYKAAYEMAENFIPGDKNFLFTGRAGTGKTFLSNCIAKAVLDKGFSVVYLSAPLLFDKLASSTFGNDKGEEKEEIYNADLLIVDDLGTELNNSFVSSQLFALINERKLRKKSTIISTNYDLNRLRDVYSERISSRLLENYQIRTFNNPDIRFLKIQRGTN